MFFYAILMILVHLHLQNHTSAKISRKYDAANHVVSIINHDSDCYTQGLTFNDGFLYESCGLNGKSNIRKVNPVTGEVLQKLKLSDEYFAEGLVVIHDYIYVLTWTSQCMLVIDKNSFQLLGKYRYQTHSGEGWGLTYDGKQFIASDGSSRISFFDVPDTKKLGKPGFFVETLKKSREIIVRDSSKKEVNLLNELEYLPDGHVYANVWYKDFILKINLQDGSVSEILDLHLLYPHKLRSKTADCLNGIAYNTTDNTILLTGKLWPQYYKIKVFPSSSRERLLKSRSSNGSGIVDL